MTATGWICITLVCVLAVRYLMNQGVNSVSPRAAQALLQSGQIRILDVREPSETATGHLAGAMLIPLSQLKQRLNEVPREQLLVYCASGMRSRMAASWIRKSGNDQVWNLQGGILAWRRQGYPLN